MTRDPAAVAGLLEEVERKASEPVTCPILRALELGGALYALHGMGVLPDGWTIGAPGSALTSERPDD